MRRARCLRCDDRDSRRNTSDSDSFAQNGRPSGPIQYPARGMMHATDDADTMNTGGPSPASAHKRAMRSVPEPS